MKKYSSLLIWGIIISLMDKNIQNSYTVLASLIIIGISDVNKNEIELYYKQNIIVFVLGICMFGVGLLLNLMTTVKYPRTIGVMLSIGGGFVSSYLLKRINYKIKTT
ncbi:hypothetical protein [Clostridium frigidicarnis]|uniref:Uncharacterized protein n=1 Tax=Clostridium frigidicarnis TaxID=84698 RepID=A0A1I0Z8L6_9CLOT|nr:hypothetical protein [Clostridium frigidicarnis]SFB21752.1 hypothetical protein SAMN04488528_101836 [Clostridium frigidicarnis]